ncbi:MAG: SDR family NAD(P)-dependent oxidoreductase [Acidimicrobiales bacterium]
MGESDVSAESRRRLEGRAIVVTGAGAGIGRACVERYHAEGASIVAADLDPQGLDALAGDATGPIEVVTVDVTQPDAATTLVERSLEVFGRLDVYHANAGGAFPTPFVDTGDEQYEQVRALNLDAVWNGSRAAIPVFLEAGRGVFLATSSGAGINAVDGLSAYGAAKAGVQALVKALALEHGREGVRACAIAPGMIESPGLLAWLETLPGGVEARAAKQTAGRLGLPSEIAAAAAFLASDDASFVNGVTLAVDGGTQAVLGA